jgi:hypothetical protein
MSFFSMSLSRTVLLVSTIFSPSLASTLSPLMATAVSAFNSESVIIESFTTATIRSTTSLDAPWGVKRKRSAAKKDARYPLETDGDGVGSR